MKISFRRNEASRQRKIKKIVYGSVGELPFFTTSINYTTSKKTLFFFFFIIFLQLHLFLLFNFSSFLATAKCTVGAVLCLSLILSYLSSLHLSLSSVYFFVHFLLVSLLYIFLTPHAAINHHDGIFVLLKHRKEKRKKIFDEFHFYIL